MKKHSYRIKSSTSAYATKWLLAKQKAYNYISDSHIDLHIRRANIFLQFTYQEQFQRSRQLYIAVCIGNANECIRICIGNDPTVRT